MRRNPTRGQLRVPRRILVVDGNMDAAQSFGALLRSLGHEVQFAHDDATAMQVARTFRPQFVFLDLSLPWVDGFEVARSLRREPGSQAATIIALTASGHDELRALEAGCDQYIVKPIAPEFLASLFGVALR